MSDYGDSAEPVPPSDDYSPPPEDSPPADSSPPPPSDSNLSPLPSFLPPIFDSPPPPAEFNDSPPPPEELHSPPPHPPPPPADSETPPSPPNESDSSPPPPESQSPPPPSFSPETPPPSESPPSQSKNSSPAPTKSPSIQQPSTPPAISPPVTLPTAPPSPFQSPPPKPKAVPGLAPVVSPSLSAPSKVTSPTSNGNGDQRTALIAGMAVSGFAIMAVIAVIFLVRRKKKQNLNSYNHSHYLPHTNFSGGFGYGHQDPSKIYSGPGGSMYNNSQQHSSTGNSYISQRGPYSTTHDSAILGTGQTNFSYEELAETTQGFAHHNIIGEGGFGCVYKGTLHDGKVVAVKQLKAGSGQGDREFKAEVEIISRVHHRHLVSLVGYCISDPHRLLIYEFVSNQTLEHHLHGKGMPVLEWSKRVRIAIGSAKGLAYLHEDCHPKIIHRDIKSANILLDDEYEAQVADFGLARLNDTTQTHVSTRVMGTFGYLAPEYAQSGKLTDRSDVFSFGVVLLELVTGRKPVDQDQPLGEESLVEWARPLLHKAVETGDIEELVDKRLEKHYVEHEVIRMIETAAACVRHSGPKRPRMVQVVRALDCDGDSGENGIKVSQTTTYSESGQYNQDMSKFRQMAFGSEGDASESRLYSGAYSEKTSSNFSVESETRPFNNRLF